MQLQAKGRILDIGANNRPIYNQKQRVDGARLVYDAEQRMLIIQVDHSECPGFWLKVQIPVALLETVDQPLEAQGRIVDQGENFQPIFNAKQRVDGARLLCYEEDAMTLRVDHSECPGFWLEMRLPLREINAFCNQ
jgi:hypothetical protein